MVNEMSETWLPIPGFEGQYEASSLGHVRSLTRVINGRVQPGRVMRAVTDRHGYLIISLRQDGRVTRKGVHQWVALAFHGEPDPGQEVRHLDGDQLNNIATNLKWGTRSENVQDSVRHGTHYQVARRIRLRSIHGE